jgi:outer membrane lipoprotein SlyB
MANQIFCAECGAANHPDATFCENCGRPIAAVEPAPVAAAAPAVVTTTAKRGMPGWLIALLALIVVAAVARFVFPLQTGLAILAIEEKLHIGPYANDSTANTKPADSTAITLRDGSGQLTTLPNNPARPVEPTAPPPSVTVLRPDNPPPSTRRDSTPVIRQIPNTPPPASPPGTNAITVTRNDPPPPPATVPPPAPAPPPPPAPPPAAPVARVTAGSTLTLKAADKVCTDKNKEGDRFRAAVDQDVTGANGARIPKGSFVTLAIDHLKRSNGSKENTVFSVVPTSIDINGVTYPVNASVDTVAVKKNGKGLLGALVGAAAGVAATRAAGGNAGAAVAGGIVGGAAGGVVGSHLGNEDGCIDKNALLRITLRSDLNLSP